MIKQEILEACAAAIDKDFGSLTDLPPELANTIANVYYKFFALGSPGFDQGVMSFIEDATTILGDFKFAKQLIDGLRKIDKRTKPNLYDYTVEFILDALKYHLDKVHDKTGLRRKIER